METKNVQVEVPKKRVGKGLTPEEKEFLSDYLSKRNTGQFKKAEMEELSQRLREVDGIERSKNAVYMHLKRLSVPKVETKESMADKNKALLEKLDHHLQEVKRCFERQFKRQAEANGGRAKRLEIELKKVRDELKEAHVELKRLTKLRQVIEDIQEKEGRNHKILI